jgi:hypothetical protein
MVGGQLKAAHQVKMAQLEGLAQEERSKGILQYHGMLKESAAMRLATGQCSMDDVSNVAAWIGMRPGEIVKRAEALRAATPSPALVNGYWASAARPGSQVQMAAEDNSNTTQFTPSDVARPTSGSDEKLMRFTDTMVLPGNPGLNHGMRINQGIAYSR